MNRSYFNVLLAFIFLVVAMVGYILWYNALGSLSSEVADLTSQVAAKNLSTTEALAAEEELKKLSTEEGAIRTYFVAPSDIVPFLEGLQTLGSSAGAKVSVVSVSSNPNPRPHLDLALKVTGSFDAVMRASGAIEYSAHDIVVSTFALDASPSNDPKVPSSWTATLALQVGTSAPAPSTATASTTTP